MKPAHENLTFSNVFDYMSFEEWQKNNLCFFLRPTKLIFTFLVFKKKINYT